MATVGVKGLTKPNTVGILAHVDLLYRIALSWRLIVWSYEFFNDLYHRFLLTPKIAMKCVCLQAIAVVYGRCYDEIGPFNDTKYIVGMLDRVCDCDF